MGDLDGDGVSDIAVGALYDDDGGTDCGAVYILFMATDGNVKSAQKISNWGSSHFNQFYSLGASDYFGTSVASMGDLDGDGVIDLVVGAAYDDDVSSDSGAVYILYL